MVESLSINIKKRLQDRCFSVNIAKILRITFFIEYLQWPPLKVFTILCSAPFKTAAFQKTFTCSKTTIETLEKAKKLVQSKQ